MDWQLLMNSKCARYESGGTLNHFVYPPSEKVAIRSVPVGKCSSNERTSVALLTMTIGKRFRKLPGKCSLLV